MSVRSYRRLNDDVFSRIEPERAHALALRTLASAWKTPGGRRLLSKALPAEDERLRLRVWGLPFANPIGVAAGLDKDALAVEPLIELGFKHVEVGTVTLKPQSGNEKPRVWRVPESAAVINAMGFPSQGAATVRSRLISLRPNGVIGINIGINRSTPTTEAARDYQSLVATLFEVAQYFTVNISSPNTPGLRSLQMSDQLVELMAAVQDVNRKTADLLGWKPRPVLVKIAPDLLDQEVEQIAATAAGAGADGIVAVNTTTSRTGISGRYADLPGGLSGRPLRTQANHVVKILYRTVGRQIPIIGVGGISSGADAVERIKAGATLVQLYTGFIYSGPGLPARILTEISRIADEDGWKSIESIIGSEAG